MEENSRRLTRGESLQGITGTDEIARLDRAFRDMAQELKRSQADLSRQHRVLQAILTSMGDGLVVANLQGQFLHFNPAAEELLGIGATALPTDQWTAHYGCFRPDGVTPYPTGELPLVRALRGEVVDEAELYIRNAKRPQGVWISCTGRPTRDEHGQLWGGVVVFRDIGERKRTEEAIRRLNDELEQRVEMRTAELADANRELSQKNQENEMFVYSVSHDLRSPLVNLQGFSLELEKGAQALTTLLADDAIPPHLRSRGQSALNGKMTKSLGFIKSAVLRLGGIIDALLRLSRAGRVEYRYEQVDVNQLVANIVAAAQGSIEERNASVTVHDLPPAWGDKSALEQVFANLIGNALVYLDPNRPGVIEIGSRASGHPSVPNGHLVYYVKDNGLGIAEPHQQKIFQVFQRAHPGVGKGEGIGLAIVARVVERHHGRVWIESTAGAGSTFFIALPKKPAGQCSASGSLQLNC